MKEYLNRSKDWLPLGLAAVYVLGFVIVGIHLAGYGASSLDLFKAQYLATGFWFCFAVAAYFEALRLVQVIGKSVLPVGRAPGFPQKAKGAKRLSFSISANIILALGIGIMMFAFRYLHIAIPSFKELDDAAWRVAFSSLPFALCMAILDISFWLQRWFKEKAAEKEGDFPIDKWVTAWASTIVYVVIFLLFSVWTFATTVYRVIPFSLGGGEPREVVFWLGSGTGPVDSFLERDGTTGYSVHYELLVENESSLVVISPKEKQRAIEFDRKAVGAVVVLGTRPRTAPAHFSAGGQ